MTLVERVARALWEQDVADRCHQESFRLDWYKDQAVAALKVMREPTDSMLDGDARTVLLDDRMSSPKLPKAQVVSAIWQAMIDQAIKEAE